MNLPNTVHSQHYQPNRIDSLDFGFSSTHFNEYGENKVESSSSSAAAAVSSRNNSHTIRETNQCYFDYDKYFDSHAAEYHEHSFASNTIANQQCIQPIGYNTNYDEIIHTPNDTGTFRFIIA